MDDPVADALGQLAAEREGVVLQILELEGNLDRAKRRSRRSTTKLRHWSASATS